MRFKYAYVVINLRTSELYIARTNQVGFPNYLGVGWQVLGLL